MGEWCRHCGHRYAQDRTRLCRTCLKAAGVFYGVLELERVRLERAREKDRARRVPADELQRRPPIERVIDGRVYWITWDGA
jgi:predicted  nucleic acid-binding Zn-ribbon protein